jgi:hypothetical protein
MSAGWLKHRQSLFFSPQVFEDVHSTLCLALTINKIASLLFYHHIHPLSHVLAIIYTSFDLVYSIPQAPLYLIPSADLTYFVSNQPSQQHHLRGQQTLYGVRVPHTARLQGGEGAPTHANGVGEEGQGVWDRI